MTAFDTTPPISPEPILPEAARLWPQHLVDIFLRPKHFFSGQLALGSTPYVLFVTWLLGLSSAIDRVDGHLVKADLGTVPLNPLLERAVSSWPLYWACVLVAGVLAGAGLWYVGGWWYRVRAGWAGARDPDPRLARLVYVYSGFVLALPAVAVVVLWTLAFPDYRTAWTDDESFWSLALVVFPFWSCWASFRGVTSVFEVSRAKAAVWFLVLPSALYLLLIGGVALAYMFGVGG